MINNNNNNNNDNNNNNNKNNNNNNNNNNINNNNNNKFIKEHVYRFLYFDITKFVNKKKYIWYKKKLPNLFLFFWLIIVINN